MCQVYGHQARCLYHSWASSRMDAQMTPISCAQTRQSRETPRFPTPSPIRAHQWRIFYGFSARLSTFAPPPASVSIRSKRNGAKDTPRRCAAHVLQTENNFLRYLHLFRNEFPDTSLTVVENSGSEDQRFKNHGKRVRFERGRGV